MSETKNYQVLSYECACLSVPRKPLEQMLKEYRERQEKKKDEQDDLIKWWEDKV
jgi:hypothetical protein